MKLFIDTNVLIDYLAHRDDFFTSSATVFELIFQRKVQAAISSLSFVNCFYVLRKVFEPSLVKTKLVSLMSFVEVSPINSYHISMALASYKKDFEDSVQFFFAIDNNCDVVITRDKKGFDGFPVKCFSPDEFIAQCINDHK